MPDTPGQVATGRDTSYALSIEDACALYARAGHPRTPRSIQRYCASGHLDSIKETTLLGDRYFIEPGSVARHIAQIEELISLDTRATSRGLARQDATVVVAEIEGVGVRQTTTPSSSVADSPPQFLSTPQGDNNRQAPTGSSMSRPVATELAAVSPHVAQLEREVEHLKEDKEFLRGQVKTKDEQIAALLERDRETNILVRGLQQMLSPLLGGGRPAATDDARMVG